MAKPNTPKEDEATAKRARISKDTWNIVSNIEDFDRLQYVLRPYVRRMPVVNYQFKSLHTDTHSFRRLVTDDDVVSFDQFRDAAGPKRVCYVTAPYLNMGSTMIKPFRRNGPDTVPTPRFGTHFRRQSRIFFKLDYRWNCSYLPTQISYPSLFPLPSLWLIYCHPSTPNLTPRYSANPLMQCPTPVPLQL